MAAAGVPAPDLWQQAISQLSPDIKARLNLVRSGRNDIVSAVLQTVEEKRLLSYKRRWKVKIRPGGEEIVIRDVLEKVSAWTKRFRDFGDVAVQFDPAHASLPWAAVRFLLQSSINDAELHAGIVEDLELITRILARFKEFEKVHLANTSALTQNIEAALAELYAMTLECLASHIRYFKESTGKRMLKAPFKTMDEELRKKIQAKEGEVLKFASLNDTARAVAMESSLVRLFDRALVSEKEVEEAHFFELLAWLSPLSFMRAHENIKRARMSRSGQWILQHPSYTSWKSASSSSILLLHGIRGCGKTNLCSVVVDALLDEKANHPQAAPIAYFYCADLESERERRRPDDVFRSIVRQLTTSTTPQHLIHASIASCYERMKARAKIEGSPDDVLNLRTSECLDVILETLDNNPAIIVVDALDEVASDMRYLLLESLNEIVRKSANVVKIFVTSRDDSIVFDTLQNAQLLRVSQNENGTDVERYTRSSVETAVKGKWLLKGHCTGELQDVVVSKLVAGAGEMFVWIKMQLSNLCRLAHERDIMAALSDVCTTTLDELYASTLESIKQSGETARDITIRAFSWLLYMQQPLTLDEFIVILGSQSSLPSLTPAYLVRLCSGLVDFTSGHLGFSHHSVQEFLKQQPELSAISGHRILARDSLVLCDWGPPSNLSVNSLATNAAWRYAATHWLYHLQQAGIQSRDDELYKRASSFIFDEGEPALMFRMWLDSMTDIAASLPRDHPHKTFLHAVQDDDSSPLFALSVYGLHFLVSQNCWPMNIDWNRGNRFGQTALYLASCSGDESLASFLVNKGVDTNIECGAHGSALHAACFHGHKSGVDVLLSTHTDMNAGSVYDSAIDAAFRGDREAVAMLLLKSGSIISSQQVHDSILARAAQAGFLNLIELLQASSPFAGQLPDKDKRIARKAITSGKIAGLHFLTRNASSASDVLPIDSTAIAATCGHKELVEFSLDAGLDVDAPGPLGAPLRSASLVGHEPIVRLLLDRGADVNANDHYGNALHAAAMKGNAHIIKTLVRAGADVNLEGDFYGTALQAACFRGHKDVVEVLLNAGADVFAAGYTKDAFHAASEGGNHGIVMLLMNHGYVFRSRLRISFMCSAERPSSEPQYYVWDHSPSLDLFDVLHDIGSHDTPHDSTLRTPQRTPATKSFDHLSPNFALQVAASRGHLSVVRQILDSSKRLGVGRQNVKMLDDALHLAIKNGYAPIVDTIVQAQAPLAKGHWLDAHFGTAVALGNLAIVTIIIDAYPKHDFTQNFLRDLICTACSGSHTVVSRLLSLWNEVYPEVDPQLRLPRMLNGAVTSGNSETVELVLRYPWHPSAKSLQSSFEAACSSSDASILLSLRTGMTPSFFTPSLVTACILNAAVNRHSAVLVYLLDILRPSLSNSVLHEALFRAAADGYLENVKVLLESADKSNAFPREVTTQALAIACMSAHHHICKTLINAGADVNRVVNVPAADVTGQTFQHPYTPRNRKPWEEELDYESASEDSETCDPEIQRLLLEMTLEDEHMPIHDRHRDSHDFTALQACLEGFKRAQGPPAHEYSRYPRINVSEPEGQQEFRETVLKCLLDHGADVNATGGCASFPLCRAARFCPARCVSWMIERGADVSLQAGTVSVLDYAVNRETETMAVVKALFDAGAGDFLTSQDLQRLINVGLKFVYPLRPDWDTAHASLKEGPGAVILFLLERDSSLRAEGRVFVLLLQSAAIFGEVHPVKLLIERGADLHSPSLEYGYYGTVLIAASHFGQAAVVTILLEAGADPTRQDSRNETALSTAAERGHLEVVRALLGDSRTLIDLGASGESVSLRGDRGLRSLSKSEPLPPLSFDATTAPPDPDKERDWTPLRLAINNQHVQIALELLEAGAFVDFSRPDTQQILIDACYCGSVHLFEALLARDPRIKPKLKDCVELLLEAIKYENEDLVNALLHHGLASTLRSEAVRDIDKCFVSMCESRRDLSGFSQADKEPLPCAARQGNSHIMQILLDASSDYNGRWLGLVLCEAARKGNTSIVQQLLERGAYVLDPENKYNAVAVAGMQGQLAVMEQLLDTLSDEELEDVCSDLSVLIREEAPAAALELMFKYTECTSDVLVAGSVSNDEKVIRMALEQGVDPNHGDSEGLMPLHAAAHFGHLNIVRLLLSRGADTSIQCTPMTNIIRSTLEGLAAPSLVSYDRPDDCKALARQIPCVHMSQALRMYQWLSSKDIDQRRRNVYEHILKTLLDHGAPIDFEQGLFGNILHLSAFVRSKTIFELALSNGGSVASRGGYFDTVLDAAVAGGDDEMIQLVHQHLEVLGPSSVVEKR